jgi:flagellar motor protein MotB
MNDDLEITKDGIRVGVSSKYRKLRAAQNGLAYWDLACQDIILEEMGEFLPRVTESNDKSGLFQKAVGGREICKSSNMLGLTKSSRATLQRLNTCVDKLKDRLSDSHISPEARLVLKHFKLPDPIRMPECYRRYWQPLGPGLAILWGFEGSSSDSIDAKTAIAQLPVEEWWKPWLRALGILLALLLLLFVLWLIIDLIYSWPHAELVVTPKIVHVDDLVTFDATGSRGDRVVLSIDKVDHNLPLTVLASQERFETPGSRIATVVASREWMGISLPSASVSAPFDVLPVHPETVSGPPPQVVIPSPEAFSAHVITPQGSYPATVEFKAGREGTVDIESLGERQKLTATDHLDISKFDQPGQYIAKFNPSSTNDEAMGQETEANIQLFPSKYVSGSPVASLVLSKKTLQTGESVHADAGRSFDPKDPKPEKSISWDGGATFEGLGSSGADHAFSAPGDKSIILKVANSGGKVDTDQQSIHVDGPPSQVAPQEKHTPDASTQTLKSPVTQPTTIRINSSVLFASGSADFSVAGTKILKEIGDAVIKQDLKVRIRGFTDTLPITGALAQSYHDNLALSTARAKAVADFMTDILSVDKSKIICEGLGETHPLATNDTEEGRKLNRRVEITLEPSYHSPQPSGANPDGAGQ